MEDVLFCFSIIAIYFGNIFKRQFLYDLLSLTYLFYFVLETTSYIAVSSNFSSSYMFLLIESNKEELTEFSASYITLPIISFIILMATLFFLIRKVRITLNLPKKHLIGVFLFIGVIVVLKMTGLIERNAYHNVVRGVYGYIELQNSVKFNNNILKEDINITSDNEVFVFVLGESTTSQHMQLYGYERETTPFLDSLKDNLHIYDNVISSHVFTLKVVPKIITSLDYNSSGDSTTSLIQIFKGAGFKTYWLANQRAISFHDNVINKIASSCHEFRFYTHLDDVKTTTLDDVIFPDYKRILKEPGKKVIFIKLLGTHFDYNKRYPEDYDKFTNSNKSTKKQRIINYYDNAVLYNDYIVYSFIEELEKHNKKSALLYLSDHGENVYDDSDFFGRSEAVLRESMFEVPFFVWTSKDFEFPNDFEYKPNRAFMTDNTYESIGHLFGVLYSDMDKDKSIFSKSFKERKRIVIDSIDYDSYFLEKHE
ncbi:phosphoethanolamine transferase [Seonamhaeicola maritimus]|uniref:Phosphoethanolamine transferase n=1 Tax=Seonamhaeicola maritimus TaxID=2591822 RepID=A0A5C7GDN0_9FLAO|nr:phosphoethanolamine transferase [Seonamhaeicola maritimus]TXG34558.1 phosphoethanolamine transferase [Seonamhaeicola maritimus]